MAQREERLSTDWDVVVKQQSTAASDPLYSALVRRIMELERQNARYAQPRSLVEVERDTLLIIIVIIVVGGVIIIVVHARE